MGGAKTELNLGLLMIKRQKIIGSTIRASDEKTKNAVMTELSNKLIPHLEVGEIKPDYPSIFAFRRLSRGS